MANSLEEQELETFRVSAELERRDAESLRLLRLARSEGLLIGLTPASEFEFLPMECPRCGLVTPMARAEPDQPNEQKIARIVFEQMNNCSIRDPNSQFSEGSGPLRAARAILAAVGNHWAHIPK